MSKRIIPEVPGYTKVQVISFFKMKLKSDPAWARKACVVLYDQQSELEKRNHLSAGHNNSGFGRNDSPLLTHIACKIKQHRENSDDLKLLQLRLPRYASQLICMSYDKDEYKTLRKQLDFYYKNLQLNLPY
jgi:hypothetical protein